MMTRANQQAKQLIHFGTVLNVQEKLDQIGTISVNGIHTMARRIFSGKPTLAALGPLDRLENFDSIVSKLAA